MKTLLYMAMSVDGYIAREDGSEDFLSDENWQTFCVLANEHGNFIVGRKTYEAVKHWPEGANFDSLHDIEKIIISRDTHYNLASGYTLVSSPQDALAKLQERGVATALVSGGAHINSVFANAHLLDELMLNIEPVVIGKGIPLFAPGVAQQNLAFISSKVSDSGIITLLYRVKKQAGDGGSH